MGTSDVRAVAASIGAPLSRVGILLPSLSSGCATPPSGFAFLWHDATDGGLKITKSNGTTVNVELTTQTVTYSERTAPYTVGATDYALAFTTAGTVTLSAVVSGRVLRLKNVSAGTVTLDGAGAETVEGAATYALGANSSVDLIGSTGGWRVF